MQLNEVVPWGQSLAEYRSMFQLSNADLKKRILGCGDGPASFNAEMTELGYSVISIDPIYQFSPEHIRQRIEATYEPVISQTRKNADRYCWKVFRNAHELGQARLAAMEIFLQDYASEQNYRNSSKRYLSQSLPCLSFSDNCFDLCVCSHFLFLYSDHLSLDFHLESIAELLRVASEVRIFPLLSLSCELSPYVEPVIQTFSNPGRFTVEIQSVDYEVQKGGNQLLKITRSPRG